MDRKSADLLSKALGKEIRGNYYGFWFFIAILLVMGILVFAGLQKESDQKKICQDKGGVYIRPRAGGPVCLKSDAILK